MDLSLTFIDQEFAQNDPIPPHIKKFFFQGKSPPDILQDYDVLGFDVDHCLVKYNI